LIEAMKRAHPESARDSEDAFIAIVDLGERFLLRWRPRGAALIVDHGT